jgi:hypothetical protein
MKGRGKTMKNEELIIKNVKKDFNSSFCILNSTFLRRR